VLGDLLLVLLAWAQVATASGTSSIRGRVTAHETGKPIARVVLKLGLLGPPGTQRTTTTDADGRYEFTGLVGGTYRLTANPQENEGIYLSGQFGAPVSFDPANGSLRPSLELHDGQTFTADISLPNAMPIAGHVDERGRADATHASISDARGDPDAWGEGSMDRRGRRISTGGVATRTVPCLCRSHVDSSYSEPSAAR
jgi:Carboxypeptidase regulatory-like domain